ncbi:hypothetical protein NHQ30_011658 [Ciborinia camelliae]|nr:hypothetical protein NHQ30_011658 [Ciborinia camelliae]
MALLVKLKDHTNVRLFLKKTIHRRDPAAKAVAYYGLIPNLKPITTASTAFNDSVANICKNEPLTQTTPWFPIIPDPKPPATLIE